MNCKLIKICFLNTPIIIWLLGIIRVEILNETGMEEEELETELLIKVFVKVEELSGSYLGLGIDCSFSFSVLLLWILFYF